MTITTDTAPMTTARAAGALADFSTFLAAHPALPTPTSVVLRIGTVVTASPTYAPGRVDGTYSQVENYMTAWADAFGATPDAPFPNGARDGVPSLLHTVKAQITPDLTIQVYLTSTPDPVPSDLIPA